MTDKEKIREEVERLKEETSIGLSEHENGVEQGRMEFIEALSLFLDSLQEEPVSGDLEKAAEEYATSVDFAGNKTIAGNEADAFKAGATWQEHWMMNNIKV